MKQEDIVYQLLDNNGGYLTTKAAREHGGNASVLKRMADRSLIERVAHGLYVSAETITDPFFVAQYRCPKGIFSHETALFLHNLSDRTPIQLMMTIPSGWSTRLFAKDDIIFFYCRPELSRLGATEIETAYGHIVTVYDAGRTLCDCLRNLDRLDKDLVLTALKRYMKMRDINKTQLLEYAAIFKIRDLVLRYMEVLL